MHGNRALLLHSKRALLLQRRDLLVVPDVHVLDPDVGGVDLLQPADDVAQLDRAAREVEEARLHQVAQVVRVGVGVRARARAGVRPHLQEASAAAG